MNPNAPAYLFMFIIAFFLLAAMIGIPCEIGSYRRKKREEKEIADKIKQIEANYKSKIK